MTDNEIMQALKMCSSKKASCYRCPLRDEHACEDKLVASSFDLIRRQKFIIDDYMYLDKIQNERITKLECVLDDMCERIVEQLKESSKTYCEEYGQRKNTLYLWDAIDILREVCNYDE